MLRSTLLAVLAVLCGNAVAAAQVLDPCAPADRQALDGPAEARRPDVVLHAAARVRELSFGSQPQVRVRLLGCAGADTLRFPERRNLPRPVQPGVVYRDVHVTVEIASFLDVRCILQGDTTMRPARQAASSLPCPMRLQTNPEPGDGVR